MQVDTQWASVADEPATSLGARATATNMCYITFTSGSTGRPKGTVLQHNSVINYLLGMVRCVCPPTEPAHRSLADSMCVCASASHQSLARRMCACAPGDWVLGRTTSSCRRSPSALTRPCRCNSLSSACVAWGGHVKPAAHASKLPAGACRSCSVHWRAAASWCWQPRAARRTRSTWRA